MRLYIIRHGEALSPGVDPQRSLSGEGRRQAGLIGKFMQQAQVRVSEIWHSEKTRARETAQLIQESGSLGGTLIEKSGLLPNDPVETIATELNALDSEICIVGHLPFVGLLGAELTNPGDSGPQFVFETCAALCLERQGRGLWAVRWMISPAEIS